MRTNFLAADRVYLFTVSPQRTVGSYPTHFTLTGAFRAPGGIVSMALSLEFPPVAVSNCLSLRCPDFPRAMHVISRSSGHAYYTSSLHLGIKALVHFSIGQLVKLTWHVRERDLIEALTELLNSLMNRP